MLTGYSRDTRGVLTRYSRGTLGALEGYSKGARGHSRGTRGGLEGVLEGVLYGVLEGVLRAVTEEPQLFTQVGMAVWPHGRRSYKAHKQTNEQTNSEDKYGVLTGTHGYSGHRSYSPAAHIRLPPHVLCSSTHLMQT